MPVHIAAVCTGVAGFSPDAFISDFLLLRLRPETHARLRSRLSYRLPETHSRLVSAR